MNAFERHGIDHLSASSLNLFANQPALWCGRYLLGWRDEFGAAPNRGTAIEAGLDLWLYGDRSSDCAQKALDKALEIFALNTNGLADDAHEAERANIPLMLRQALMAMKGAPIPISRQTKVEFWIDGIDVPVIGYLDYVLDDGVLDLKTTKRMPNNGTPSRDHLAQMAGYHKARGQPVSLLYVTTAKSLLRPVTDEEFETGFADLTRAARSLQYLLSHARDAREAARFYVPDFTDFHWNDQTRALGKALYMEAA